MPDLYEQLIGELLIDPEQVSHDMDTLMAQFRAKMVKGQRDESGPTVRLSPPFRGQV